MKTAFCPATALHGSFALPFVIPTEANPDFLLRCAGQGHVCGFIKESRRKLISATNLHRKFGVA
jgi:hypothetical protein